ncbi:MAG: ribosomal protein S18-alanine N-acetyltransferase [Mariprofundaceae bacterium]
MPDTLSIRMRKGSAADLDDVYQLNATAFPEAWSRQALQHAIGHGYELYIAELPDSDSRQTVMAGYLLSQDIMDEVHILQIAVLPAFHRQQIALQLSRTLLEEKGSLPRMQQAVLEVRASNAAAQNLYQKLGFRINGRRKNYYKPRPPQNEHEDALLMSCPLRPMPDKT